MDYRDLKVGDRVTFRHDSGNRYKAIVGCVHDSRLYLINHSKEGSKCSEHNMGMFSWAVDRNNDRKEYDLQLISTAVADLTTPNMTLLERIKLITKGEPQKTLQTVGLTDSKDQLTAEGKLAWDDFLMGKFAQDFADTVGKQLLAEMEKDKK